MNSEYNLLVLVSVNVIAPVRGEGFLDEVWEFGWMGWDGIFR